MWVITIGSIQRPMAPVHRMRIVSDKSLYFVGRERSKRLGISEKNNDRSEVAWWLNEMMGRKGVAWILNLIERQNALTRLLGLSASAPRTRSRFQVLEKGS